MVPPPADDMSAQALLDRAGEMRRAGQYNEALALYMQALRADARLAPAYYEMGTLLRDAGRPQDALGCFLKAAELAPDADTHANIGVIYHLQSHLSEALEHYNAALRLNPDHIDTLNNCGALCGQIGQHEQAQAHYERAARLSPGNISTINNLGILYKATGQLDRAMDCYRAGLALRPDASLYTNLLLSMIYAPNVTPEGLLDTARDFGKTLADPLLRRRPLIVDKDPERRLRIGYVSPDFRKHAVNYFFEHLLHHHDRSSFELFGYSNTAGGDAVTTRLRGSFDHWRDIATMDDDRVADMVEADGVDILVDLAGHTGRNRLLLFARKPAHVQVTWLGFPATTGMAAMDYRITDIHAEPPGMTEAFSVEKLWRLPHLFCCFGPMDGAPAIIDHPPCEDNGYITFGCFNNFTKVSDEVLRVWAAVMARVPGSRLLLEIFGLGSARYRAEIEARLQKAGLPLDRVILEPRRPENQYVLYNRIDIALDPFPCNGGTTSMDTLWMGVPFVTLAGRYFGARMGVSILTNAGLPQLIAADIDEYVEKAVGLALDREALRAIRQGLREKVAASPVMDQAAFARDMEAAYRAMWREFCGAAG